MRKWSLEIVRRRAASFDPERAQEDEQAPGDQRKSRVDGLRGGRVVRAATCFSNPQVGLETQAAAEGP